MGDFVVQECCVHGTDLESHGPTSILCDDPLPVLPLLTTVDMAVWQCMSQTDFLFRPRPASDGTL